MELKVKFESTTPLLMHSNRGANPLNPQVKEKKAITSKRTKTDEDHSLLAALDWKLGIYYDADMKRPYIPAEMVEACFREAAKKNKLGTIVKKGGLRVKEDKIPLEYDGPKDMKSLYGDGATEFVDVRTGKLNGGSTVLITRPRFNRWSLQFTLTADDSKLTEQEVKTILENSCEQGIGDYRERYGRFTYSILKSK
jgi:hypothetical protein